ncbi:MAG: restriction endonuclease [Nevskia sp.]|nr:restriction endonuclease [Nevskia sp.]
MANRHGSEDVQAGRLIVPVCLMLSLMLSLTPGQPRPLSVERFLLWLLFFAILGGIARVLRGGSRTSPVDRLARQPPSLPPRPLTADAGRTPDLLDRLGIEQPRLRQPAPSVTDWSLDLIRALEWKRFEELCERFWKAKGYRAEPTGDGADGGIDIKLYSPSEPSRLLAVIQCKSRSSENVGVSTVRELFGVMHHVNAPMGILVTSSDFHPAARQFAQGKRIQLIGGEALLAQIEALPDEAGKALLQEITRDDYLSPTCPSCGEKMVKRSRKSDGAKFWGCRNYPRCHHVLQVRSLEADAAAA